ncbi:MAG: hypothetical protein KJ072_24460 [Verrucomicrobia bacterium]|nr:hypothetical protein [Verrucomicrobiota bacterium]
MKGGLGFVVLCGALVSSGYGAAPPGDANGDGKVTPADALLILQRSVSKVVLGVDGDGAADLNGDGAVNALDAVLALRAATEDGGMSWNGLRAVALMNGSAVSVSLRFTGASARIDPQAEVRLLSLAGESLAARSINLVPAADGQETVVTFNVGGVSSVMDLAEYVIEIHGQSAGLPVSERLSLYAITPRLSGCFLSPDTLIPGAVERARVVVQEATSGEPVPGAAVAISLRMRDQADARLLYAGQTDDGGRLEAQFEIPDGLRGDAELTANVTSGIGETVWRKSTRVAEGLSTLLTTDKPIYQPGQTIHIRTLTLRKPEGTPAADQSMVLTVADPKGNKVFRQIETINAFGVAFVDFTLATELNLGAYTISAAVGEVSAEKQVTVSRYSLPKFKVGLTTDESYYVPGATLGGDLSANYFFGKPVAHGTVKITASKFDVGFEPFAEVTGTTDAEGNFQFALELPDYFVGQPLNQGEAFVLLEAAVVDGAEHEEKTTLTVPVTSSDLLILAVPESGELVPGVENRVYLLTTYPNRMPARTTCRVTVGGEFIGSVDTDEAGIGLVEFTPEGSAEIVMAVEAHDAQGNQTAKTFTLSLDPTPGSILLRTDRTLYAVGDEVRADLFVGGRGGSVYADVLKDGRTVFSRILEPRDGRASFVVPLSAEMSGTLTLSVYRIKLGSDTIRDRKIIYVDPANDLRLQYQPSQETYLPGEPATIRMQVMDAENRPVVAAIGLNIVDEAVFALQELRPGMEKVYFYLEEQLRTPRYEIHGFEPETIIGGTPPEVAGDSRDRALGLLFASLESAPPSAAATEPTPAAANDEWTKLRDKLADALWLDLRPLLDALAGELRSYDEDQPTGYFAARIETALADDRLNHETASDPWNSRYRIRYERGSDRFTFLSAGPDKTWMTSDDLAITAETWKLANRWWQMPPDWQWLELTPTGALATGGALGGVALVGDNDWGGVDFENAVPGTRDDEKGGAAGAEPYLRQYFPETLYSNPLIITGTDGTAEIELKMADSITRWRLTGLASSMDGRLGSATASVRSFQEFFVDLDLPPTLTRGDEVSVPVAAYNYLPETQEIRVTVQPAAWFELMDAPEKTLVLGADEVSVTYFRIKTLQVGHHRLQATAYGSARSDALAREIEVVPDGKEFLVTHSGRLSELIEQVIQIPEAAIDGASKIFVKIYPGLFSQVVEGLDSMLRMPFGCFEQTSSVTYPNVLAVQYMKTTGQITPEILMKAEGFISAGYQRLLSYEVEGGGFEWFGNAPAHNVLTTYGLLEFSDMSTVWYVDPAVIRRTQDWLVADQEPDGSWIPTDGGIAEGAIDRYQNDVLRTTAYVVWGLTASGYNGSAVDAGVAYLEARLADPALTPETYTLALCAHALLRDPNDPLLPSLFSEFEQRKQSNDDQVWWSDDAPTMTYSTGQGADVELTALLAQAYMRSGFHPETVTKALNYLVAAKDGNGNFGSTQATVQALKAFCMAAGGATQPPDATVRISLNDAAPAIVVLNAGNADLLHLVDLQEQTFEGENTVRIRFEGTGGSLYQVVGRYYLPWADVDPPAEELIGIDVQYDRTVLAVNDTVTCTVRIENHRPGTARMVVIDVGVPPGFDVVTEDLEQLVGNRFQKYQLAGRQVIFYLEELRHDTPVEFDYRLLAKYPVRAQTPESTVYEYYTPEIRAVTEPQELVVSP